MKYRQLGETGLSVSALGFGAMRLPEKDGEMDRRASENLIRAGIEGGINYLDTAPLYCYQLSEEILGRAIKGYDRSKLVLSTKNPEQKDVTKWWEHLHTSLKRLGSDYIDLYHFWGIKGREFRENIAPPGMYAQAQKANEQGKIRHIGFSFHDDRQEIHPIIDSGLFSAMTVQFSLLDRKLAPAINYAHEKGLGVVIMGPLAGGRLAHSSPLMDILSPDTKERISLGLRFVLSQPGVTGSYIRYEPGEPTRREPADRRRRLYSQPKREETNKAIHRRAGSAGGDSLHRLQLLSALSPGG